MANKKHPNQKKMDPSITLDDEEKVFEKIAGLLTHKLRNPLGGIKGFASLLERDLKDSPDLQKIARRIVEGTNNIDSILSSLMLYATPLELKQEEVNYSEYLRKFFNEIQIPSTVNLSLTIPKKPIEVSIDCLLFSKALSILFSNALFSTHSEGSITVSIQMTEQDAILIISDNGDGIPELHHKNVFSPFFLPPYGGPEGDLATARKIILAHGGSIELLSGDHHTNTFHIYLPLKTRAADVN